MTALPAQLPEVPTAPDLLAPVHAFRDWRISPDGLTSPRTGTVWTDRVMTAQCRPRSAETLIAPPHQSPGESCTCGIHAYFRASRETSRVDFSGVTGIVSVWGHVAVHEAGLRAEHARVEALSVYARWTRRQKAVVTELAADLGVDVVDLADLEAAAERYATPLPAGLIPAPQSARIHRRRRPVLSRPRLVSVEP